MGLGLCPLLVRRGLDEVPNLHHDLHGAWQQRRVAQDHLQHDVCAWGTVSKGGSAVLYVDITLTGTTDGRTAADLSDPVTLSGTAHVSSSYSLCLADASANSEDYTSIEQPAQC